MTGSDEQPGSDTQPGPAQAYERSWARLCAGPLDTVLAGLGPASGRLLDAGCGTGNVTGAAAPSGWSVTALDPDDGMLRTARAACDGLPVGWVRSALPRTGLRAGAFDAVVANLVVNNLADPLAATGELARVVRPGGLVALTAWASGRTTHIALLEEALGVAGLPDPRHRRPAEVDFERTPDGLASLARRTGLVPVEARELGWDWPIGWDDLWSGVVATLGGAFLDLDGAVQDRVRDHLRAWTSALQVGEELRVPTVAVSVLARRPPGGAPEAS